MALTVAAQQLQGLVRPVRRASWTITQVAKKCGVSPQAVHKWVRGTARPEEKMRRRIEKHFAIAMADWDQFVANDVSPAPEAA